MWRMGKKNMKKPLLFYISLFLSVSFFLPAVRAEKKKYTIDFDRQVKSGEVYELFVKLDRTSEYIFHIGGAEKKMTQYDVLNISFSGILTVEKNEKVKVGNKEINQTQTLLKIRTLSGSINGKKIDAEHLSDKSFRMDITCFPAAVVPVDPDVRLKKEELYLLQNIFIPGEGNKTFSSFTGKSRNLEVGEVFTLNTKELRKAFAEKKINCKESELTATCRFDGFFPFRGINCGRFTIRMKSDKIPGFQFHCQSTLFLPAKKEQGVPVNIQRTSVEFLTRYISPANHFASGGQISRESKESLSLVMLPYRKIVPHKGLDGGFFDLLRRK